LFSNFLFAVGILSFHWREAPMRLAASPVVPAQKSLAFFGVSIGREAIHFNPYCPGGNVGHRLFLNP